MQVKNRLAASAKVQPIDGGRHDHAQGHLRLSGHEPLALREQIERLTAAIERAAKAEGAEAVKAAGQAAREIAARAAMLMDELAGKAEAAQTAAGEGRKQLEDTIREKPLIAVALAAVAGFLIASLLRR